MGVGIFSQVRSDRRGEAASSCARGVSDSIIGKNSSPGRLSSSGTGCPGTESPSLELFERHIHVALRDMV